MTEFTEIPVSIALLAAIAPKSPPTPLPPPSSRTKDCIHLGKVLDRRDDQGNIRGCRGCWLMACAKLGTCGIAYKRTDAPGHCWTCDQYEADQ